MKVMCISDKYIRTDNTELPMCDILTIGKIYDVIIPTSKSIYKKLFKVKCDDGVNRAFPEQMLIDATPYIREKKLKKLGI
jgi:rRNA processing protein Gar1